MTDYIKAWQCIGCGRLEAPQPCLGICQDRKVQLVDAVEHEAVLAQLALADQRARRFEALARQLASTTPHAGGWELSYRMLQSRARRALLAQTDAAPPVAPPSLTIPDPSSQSR